MRERLRYAERDSWEPLRWPIGLRVLVRVDGACLLPVVLDELWNSGCRLDVGYRVRTGVAATLRIDGLAALRGRIHAFDGGFAEMGFDQPLHLATVRHIFIRAREAIPA